MFFSIGKPFRLRLFTLHYKIEVFMKRHFYFFRPGKLFRKDNTICYEPAIETDPNEDENLQDTILLSSLPHSPIVDSSQRTIIPINEIDSIFIFADVHFNSRFIEFAASNFIPVHLFNYYGKYKGTFYPINESYSGTFILRQCSFYLKYQRRMVLARKIIQGASHNIVKNISRYLNKNPLLQGKIQDIKNLVTSIENAIYTSQLMGIEANIRKIYYSAFNDFINSEIKFTKREFHPPTDPMNSLISFSNALVYSAVLSEIYRTQLNPFISFLHEPGDNRFSLAYDIAEIFKPLLADRLIFKLLNNGSIRPEHFVYRDGGCFVGETGRKIIVKEFDNRLNKTIFHRKLGHNVSYRRLIRLECYKLVSHIKKEKEYEPFKIWW